MAGEQDDVIRTVLSRARRVAVVGLSPKPWRESHGVAVAMQRQGYEIVPVNPNAGEVLGEQAYPTLHDVPGAVDLVDVFRREEYLAEVAQAAADIGAPALWLQLGLRSPEARRIAAEAGLDYVEDRCLKVEILRFGGELTLPPPAA